MSSSTSCCALGCSNSVKAGFKLYRIPSSKMHPQRRKLWLKRINRPFFEPKNEGLCKVHFDASQFEVMIPDKLKHNAVPTIFPNRYGNTPKKKKNGDPSLEPDSPSESDSSSETDSSSESDSSLDPDSPLEPDNSWELDSPLEPDSSLDLDSPLEPDVPNPPLETTVEVIYEVEEPPPSTAVSSTINEKCATATASQSWAPTMEDIDYLNQCQGSLRILVAQLQEQVKFMETNLEKFLNSDQIEALKCDDPSSVTWSDATINKALQLRLSCGQKGYQLLLAQGFPLPTEKELKESHARRCEHTCFCMVR